MRTWIALLLVVLTLSLLTSCVKPETISEQAAKLEATVAAVSAEVPRLEAALAAIAVEIQTMPDGEAKTAAISVAAQTQAQITRAKIWLAQAQQALQSFAAAHGDAGALIDAAEQTGKAIGASVPPPWGYIISFGSIALAALFRAWQNRRSGHLIAASLNGVLTLTPEQAKLVSAAQGASAKRIVDEAQGKRLALPI